jgi:hypothetical protein
MKRQNEQDALYEIWPYLTPWQRKWLRTQGEVGYGITLVNRWLSRADLWLFPPLAFFSVYRVMSRFIPPHPLAPLAIIGTSFNAATLTLLVIRPSRRYRRQHHDPTD